MDKSNKDKGNLNFLKQENTNLNKSVSRSICSINDNNQDISTIICLFSLYAN